MLACYLSHFLAACVFPPEDVSPSVIESREMRLISHITRGKNNVSAGRFDVAEFEFRQALAVDNGVSSVYNDLGYVLGAQNRLEEAEAYFRRAVQLKPDYVIARENLAQTLYKSAKFESALEQYVDLLDMSSLASSKFAPNSENHQVQVLRPAEIHRNISLANVAVGKFDEGYCHSVRAVQNDYSIEQISEHAKLLLSMNNSAEAAEFLGAPILALRDKVSASLMLDYAIALYGKGDYNLSKQAASKILSLHVIGRFERLSSKLLLLLIARRENSMGTTELPSVDVDVFEEDRESFCGDVKFVAAEHWPFVVVEDFENLLASICDV
ncbi:MAG: tetratricopeptide repeat protein [Deltaproteobacteria bacterium]|nr:tetratricopeptide repeat protein [Deltaproteobacteria bacterium]